MIKSSTPKPGSSAGLCFGSESTLSSLTFDQVESFSNNDMSQNYILDTPAKWTESNNRASTDKIEWDWDAISFPEEGYRCHFCDLKIHSVMLEKHFNHRHRITRENFKQAQIQLNGLEATNIRNLTPSCNVCKKHLSGMTLWGSTWGQSTWRRGNLAARLARRDFVP